MKRLSVFLVAALCALSLQAAVSKDEAAIRSVLDRFAEAQKSFDAKSLDQILSSDYVEVSPAGEIDSRAKVLSFYTPEAKAERKIELSAYRLENPRIRVYGDTAVVVASLPFSMKGPDGSSIDREFTCTFVLTKTGKAWQVTSSQFTGVRK